MDESRQRQGNEVTSGASSREKSGQHYDCGRFSQHQSTYQNQIISFSLLKFYLKYFVSLIAASPIEELERKGMSILVG